MADYPIKEPSALCYSRDRTDRNMSWPSSELLGAGVGLNSAEQSPPYLLIASMTVSALTGLKDFPHAHERSTWTKVEVGLVSITDITRNSVTEKL